MKRASSSWCSAFIFGRSSYRFDSLHPSLSSAILFSSPYDLPPPRLPSSVALLLPLPLLPSSFPSITVRYKLFPLIMYVSQPFFFLFFNVLNSSLSTPISCSTLSFVLFISYVILAILLHSHISNALSISSSLFLSLP